MSQRLQNKAARIRQTLMNEGAYPAGNVPNISVNRIAQNLKGLDNEDLWAIAELIYLFSKHPASTEEKEAFYHWAHLDGLAAIAEARAKETLAVAG